MKMKLLFLMFFILTSNSLWALPHNEKKLAQIYVNLFKKGNYIEAIEKIDELKLRKNATKATAYFIKGICYSRLQAFEKSEKALKRSIRFGVKSKDIYYELGQVYYAMNDLENARRAFSKSYRKRFKPLVSIYYVGYIGQTLEQHKRALKSYNLIIKKNDDEKIKQAAMFQKAEINLELAIRAKRLKRQIIKINIAEFEEAFEYDEESVSGKELEKRVLELKRKYDPESLSQNKPFYLRLAYKYEYDSNVINEADEATSTAQNKESLLHNIDFNISYRFENGDLSVEPNLQITTTIHQNRTATEIYENDNFFVMPVLYTKLKHDLFDEPATFMVDASMDYTGKDTDKRHRMSFYGRSFAFSVGEEFNLFKTGTSKIQMSRKDFESYRDTSDSETYSLILTQTFALSQKLSLVSMGTISALRGDDISSDTNSLSLINLLLGCDSEDGKYSFVPTLTLSVSDPINQYSARGYEKLISPSLEFRRTFKKTAIVFMYTYTKNTSKSKSVYAYSKNNLSLMFEYVY